MEYKCISSDCHIDLIWLPPDLFTLNASGQMKNWMPYVDVEAEGGLRWISRGGADFGLVNGMGSAGRKYEARQSHRSNVMAADGLYGDGLNGIRRLTEPELPVKDQDRNGVQAKVLEGILSAAEIPKPKSK